MVSDVEKGNNLMLTRLAPVATLFLSDLSDHSSQRARLHLASCSLARWIVPSIGDLRSERKVRLSGWVGHALSLPSSFLSFFVHFCSAMLLLAIKKLSVIHFSWWVVLRMMVTFFCGTFAKSVLLSYLLWVYFV